MCIYIYTYIYIYVYTQCVYVYITYGVYIYMYIYTHVYIYIYIERERDRDIHICIICVRSYSHVLHTRDTSAEIEQTVRLQHREHDIQCGSFRSFVSNIPEGQTFDPHPHPGGFTKLHECPVTSLVAVLGFHLQWGWGSKG